MAQNFGYGDILRIDLTTRRVAREPVPDRLIECFLGGYGINDYLFWEHFQDTDPRVDPLSPDNVLIIGMGPFLGTGLGLGSKTKFTFKGPAYEMFGDSVAGGAFGAQLRWAGYDHVVITGRAESPVYVWISDDQVQIIDAHHLWGLTAGATDLAIKQEVGDSQVHTACIGPAGENLVTFASISVSVHRSAGRCGGGAVMGSKNLKAIVAKGSRGISVCDPEGFFRVADQMRELIEGIKFSDTWKKYGTLRISESYNRIGSNSWRNFRSGIVPDDALERLSAEWFNDNIKVHGLSCSPGCATACSAWYEVKGNETPGAARYAREGSGKPEYLTVASFGMMCDIRDMTAVGHLHRMCSEYSMDLQEVGNICALLMELWERGAITQREVEQWWGESLSLNWGDAETVEKILVALGTQSNKLAEIFRRGSYRGAVYLEELTGKPVLKYANYGKGGSCVNEEPRPFPIWLTNMAVASRGADHLKGASNPDKFGGTKLSTAWWGRPEAGERFTATLKGAHSAKAENFTAAANCLGICTIASGLGLPNIPFQMFADGYNALTGRKLSGEDLWLIGERVCNLEKAFNSRLGLTREDDTVCGRWLSEEVTEGPGEGMKAGDYLQQTLDEYYETKGWDKVSGLQTEDTLKRMGLQDVARVLKRDGVLATELSSEPPSTS
ncbi:MAG: aldehyde ferredoxin oxidoreductase family protein [Dehalococcoidia bacterium]